MDNLDKALFEAKTLAEEKDIACLFCAEQSDSNVPILIIDDGEFNLIALCTLCLEDYGDDPDEICRMIEKRKQEFKSDGKRKLN